MTRQSYMFTVKLLLSAAGLTLIAYFIFNSFEGRRTDSTNQVIESVGSSTPSIRLSATETSRLAGNSQPSVNSSLAKAGLVSTMVTTYRPGMTRAQKPTNNTISNMIYDEKKNWWLYGRSEKDAKWLDQFGYPTPEEHVRLSNTSDAELDGLAKNGDLNAKAHQAVRAAKKAYDTGNTNDLVGASEILTASLNGGGPYQATMIGQGFSRMAAEFRRSPASEQTEERRNMIQMFSELLRTI
jgi:hypothetical protein